jgi:hypothetical protein
MLVFKKEHNLGLGEDRKPELVGAKRKALRPRGSVLYLIYRIKVGSLCLQ